MKLGVMQPYFFPYIGYFQLINAVDTFVIFDDIQYIRRGWVNRNNILLNGEKKLISIALCKGNRNDFINQKKIAIEVKNNLEETIRHAYEKAPFYKEILPILNPFFSKKEVNFSKLLKKSLTEICSYLNLKTSFICSSELNYKRSGNSCEKIISICKIMKANHYINLPGGRSLYNSKLFYKENINLSFIEPILCEYEQLSSSFIPNLSIIDILMFNGKENTIELLRKYRLI